MDKHTDALSSIFHSLPQKRERGEKTQIDLFDLHFARLDPNRLPPNVLQAMRAYFDALKAIEGQGLALRDMVRPHWGALKDE